MQTATAARQMGEADWSAIQSKKANKAWVYEHGWTQDKLQQVQVFVRDGVIQEVLQRDHREYGIAEDGSVCTVVVPEGRDPKTGGHYEPDIVKASLKSPPGEVNHEAQRRMFAWMALHPLIGFIDQWILAIKGDDGKDDRGDWLCGPHHGGKSGFGNQLPGYIRSPNPEWCEIVPARTDPLTDNQPERGGLDYAPRRKPGRPKGSKNHTPIESIVVPEPLSGA